MDYKLDQDTDDRWVYWQEQVQDMDVEKKVNLYKEFKDIEVISDELEVIDEYLTELFYEEEMEGSCL